MSQYENFKLKNIQGFTVNKVFGYKWKMWIDAEKRFVIEDRWFEGGKKRYNLGVTVNGVQGYLEVSQHQFASMLEAYSREGQSNIIGESFTVKTNGKEGMEIRYYINADYNNGANVPTPSGYDKIAQDFGGKVVSQTPVSSPMQPGDGGYVDVQDINF